MQKEEKLDSGEQFADQRNVAYGGNQKCAPLRCSFIEKESTMVPDFMHMRILNLPGLIGSNSSIQIEGVLL